MATNHDTEFPVNGKGESAQQPTSQPTPEDYQRWLKRRSMSGNWFVCFDDFVKVMNPEEAWVLQRIINLGKRNPKTKLDKKVRPEGWIRCTVAFLQRKVRLTPTAQKRILNSLQGIFDKRKKGISQRTRVCDEGRVFIEVKTFGVPPRRFVRVDLVNIERAIDIFDAAEEAERVGIPKSRNSNPLNGRNSNPSIDRKENPSNEGKKKEVATQGGNGFCEAATHATFGTATPSPAKLLATKLHDLLAKKRKVQRPPDLKAWERTFIKFLEYHSFDEIDDTLNEHERRIGEKFWPKAYSADSFCDEERYTKMRESIAESRNETTAQDTIQIEVSEDAANIAERLQSELNWPKGSSSQLPVVVQSSLDAYRRFRKIIARLAKSSSDRGVQSFAEHLAESLPPAKSFVEGWLTDFNNRIADWDGWSGKITPFGIDDKQLRRKGSDWAQEFCGNTNRWDRLHTELKQEWDRC